MKSIFRNLSISYTWSLLYGSICKMTHEVGPFRSTFSFTPKSFKNPGTVAIKLVLGVSRKQLLSLEIRRVFWSLGSRDVQIWLLCIYLMLLRSGMSWKSYYCLKQKNNLYFFLETSKIYFRAQVSQEIITILCIFCF